MHKRVSLVDFTALESSEDNSSVVMNSLYISHGSEFADFDSFCKYNDCKGLIVLLFQDVSSAKNHLKSCYKGIDVVVCPFNSYEAVGIYDSVRCDRLYALKKVSTFTKYFLSFISKLKTLNSKDILKLFMFNETMRVTCNVNSWIKDVDISNSIAYTACAEIQYPDKHS